MKPSLRALFPLCVVTLSMSAFSWAQIQQNQDKAAGPTQSPTTSGPQKPKHKLNEVVTDDSIALLSVRRASRQIEAPKTGQATLAAKETSATPEEMAKRDAEIAALRKQIKDKQVRIEFLMRVFVKDEHAFLLVPGTPVDDPEILERVRYEQDELLWETAELARLKTRLAALEPPAAQ